MPIWGEKSNWMGRSLDNYKQQQRSKAEARGVLEKFMRASVRVLARMILQGLD